MILAVVRLDESADEDDRDSVAEELQRDVNKQLGDVSVKFEDAVRAHAYGKVVVVETDSAAVKATELGTRARVMTEMIGRVVGMKLPNGRTIFRKVTLQSILRGKWHRRATPGKHFIRKSVEGGRLSLPRHFFATVEENPTQLL